MKRTEVFLIVIIIGLIIYTFITNTSDTSEIDRLRKEFNEMKDQRDNFKIKRDSIYLLMRSNDSIILKKDSLIGVMKKDLIKSNTKRDSIKTNLRGIKDNNSPTDELVEKIKKRL